MSWFCFKVPTLQWVQNNPSLNLNYSFPVLGEHISWTQGLPGIQRLKCSMHENTDSFMFLHALLPKNKCHISTQQNWKDWQSTDLLLGNHRFSKQALFKITEVYSANQKSRKAVFACLINISFYVASLFFLLLGLIFPSAEEGGYWDACYNRLLKVLWQITCFT